MKSIRDTPAIRRAQLTARLPDPRPAELEATLRQARALWSSFLDFIEARSHTRWVFRGCGSLEYKFVPTVGRSSAYSKVYEVNLFKAFQRSGGMFTHSPPTNDWEWMALAQHHGLPTRLLDWTTNPLVACFFAVASGPSDQDAVVYAHSVNDGEVVDARVEADPFSLAGVRFLLPVQTAPRIVSQRGLFSVHGEPPEPWTPSDLAKHTFVIAAGVRARFRRRLFRLGIDDAHIGADLDGLCRTLRWRYEARIGVGEIMIG